MTSSKSEQLASLLSQLLPWQSRWLVSWDPCEYQAEWVDIARIVEVCFVSSLYLSGIGWPLWDLCEYRAEFLPSFIDNLGNCVFFVM